MPNSRKIASEQAAISALNEIGEIYHMTLAEMAEKRGISVERMISNYQHALEENLNQKH